MKKLISLFSSNLIIYLSILLPLYSQTDELTTGIYNGDNIKYFKNKLLVGLKQNMLEDSAYTINLNSLLISKNGVIDSTYEISGYLEANLSFRSDTLNVINFIDEFKNSGLFEYVDFSSILDPHTFFTPNDTTLTTYFDQQNLFKPENDTSKSTGTFYDRISGSNQTFSYLKHFLSIQLKTELITDTLYLANFYNFLTSQNAILQNPDIDRFGLVLVRLNDTSDAINYIDTFYNSNLFVSVYPSSYGQVESDSSIPAEP